MARCLHCSGYIAYVTTVKYGISILLEINCKTIDTDILYICYALWTSAMDKPYSECAYVLGVMVGCNGPIIGRKGNVGAIVFT